MIIVKVVAKEEFENRHGSLCRATGENLNRLFPGKKKVLNTKNWLMQ